MNSIIEKNFIKTFLIFAFYLVISDIGGYLGLFMGCSLLSLVEILFFIITKLVQTIRAKINQKIAPKSIKISKDDEITQKIENMQKLMTDTFMECKNDMKSFKNEVRQKLELIGQYQNIVSDEVETISNLSFSDKLYE